MAFSDKSRDDVLARAASALPSGLGRLLSSLKGEKKALSHMQVEVTSACPGACLYCPRGLLGRAWNVRTMSDQCFAALVPLMRTTSRVHLQGWGEPYLHPRLLDYAALARRAGCQVSTTSSGLPMSEALARGSVRSGMDILAFSVAGTDEQSNSVRRHVPLAAVQRAIGLVQAAQKSLGTRTPRLHLAYLLLADREQALDGLPELMDKWDITLCVVSTLDMPVLPAHRAWAYLPGEDEKTARARERLERVAAAAAAMGRTICYSLPGRKAGRCREDAEHGCYVDADGNLAPCVYLSAPCTAEELGTLLAASPAASTQEALFPAAPPRRIIGHVLEEDPVRLWEKSEYADFRADLAHGAAPACCLSCPKRFERMD